MKIKNYDLTLITRFDLLFKKKFEILNFNNKYVYFRKKNVIC